MQGMPPKKKENPCRECPSRKREIHAGNAPQEKEKPMQGMLSKKKKPHAGNAPQEKENPCRECPQESSTFTEKNKGARRMQVRRPDSVSKKNMRNSGDKYKKLLVNAGGILSAFGIALGGLFLVQSRLAQEEAGLLRGSGKVKVIGESEAMEASEVQVSDTIIVEKTMLTEEELAESVGNLAREREEYPHEPRQGQLTMVQAIECGKEWMENFLTPRLGMEKTGLGAYKANCYLWAAEEEAIFSYWTVMLASQGMEAELILNAVSGQVLEASVTSSHSVECPDEEGKKALLKDYGDSFGLEGSSLFLEGGDGIIYRSIGSRGLYTAVRSESVIFSRLEEDGLKNEEIFSIQLYLLRVK